MRHAHGRAFVLWWWWWWWWWWLSHAPMQVTGGGVGHTHDCATPLRFYRSCSRKRSACWRPCSRSTRPRRQPSPSETLTSSRCAGRWCSGVRVPGFGDVAPLLCSRLCVYVNVCKCVCWCLSVCLFVAVSCLFVFFLSIVRWGALHAVHVQPLTSHAHTTRDDTGHEGGGRVASR